MRFVQMCEKMDVLPLMQHTGGQSQNNEWGQRYNSIIFKGAADCRIAAPNYEV